MKKVFVLLILTLTLVIGCSSNQNQLNNLKEEGIAPFELTENEEYLLQSLDLQNNSQVISFNAPREAITLKINVKRLKDGEGWDDIQEGKLSIGSKTSTSSYSLEDYFEPSKFKGMDLVQVVTLTFTEEEL